MATDHTITTQLPVTTTTIQDLSIPDHAAAGAAVLRHRVAVIEAVVDNFVNHV